MVRTLCLRIQPPGTWLFSLMAGLLFVVICFVLPIRYETNDDPWMLLISSGVVSGAPDEHLVFINILIGYLLKWLYGSLPALEHYTLFFLLMHGIGSQIIVHYLIKRIRLARQTLPYASALFLFALVEIYLLSALQFTTTAGLLALGAVILLADRRPGWRAIGIVLFTLAFCIRAQAAVLILTLSVPFLLQQCRALRPRPYQSFVLLVLMLFAVWAIDRYHYQKDARWNYYRDYNVLRGLINDHPEPGSYKPLTLQEQIDYALLLRFFQDPAVMNKERLETLAGKLQRQSVSQYIQRIPPQLMQYKFAFLLLLLMYGVLVLSREKRIEQLYTLTPFLVFAGLLVGVSALFVLKERAFLVALLPVLFLYPGLHLRQTDRLKPLLLSAIVIGFSAYTVFRIADRVHGVRHADLYYREQMNLVTDYYFRGHPKALISYLSDFRWEYASAYRVTDSYRRYFVGGLGCASAIPFEGQLSSYKELLNRKALFLSLSNLQDLPPLIIHSMKHHYGLDVSYKVLMRNNM